MKNFFITNACIAGAFLAILLFAEFTTAQEEASSAPPAGPDVVERIAAERNLTTFASALRAADLDTMLHGRGPFTIFAPDNAAFAKLPSGTLENLLKPENKKKLARTLKLHVLAGTMPSKDLKSGKVKTDEGAKVRVTVDKDKICYGDAKVVAADIPASNGVIHVIDTVIVPD